VQVTAYFATLPSQPDRAVIGTVRNDFFDRRFQHLPAEGARFNDEIHRLPTGQRTFIRKGVYRFRTHEDANRHDEECLATGMALIASERRREQ